MSRTCRLTTAQVTTEFLKQQYVERDGHEIPFFAGVFGIFGHGNVAGIGQALEQARDSLRYYQVRNEQAMVHIAAAFAKRQHRLRTFACTTSIGPGATNMITGAATAAINRLPVLLLPGDIFATRQVALVLQQLERSDSQDVSVNDCFKPVSRYWDRINRPEQLIMSLPAAMRVLTSPADTGAVTICMPQDVQAEAFDYPAHFLEKRVYHIPRPRPDTGLLLRAVEWITASQRPLLICGGGVLYSQASEALATFAEQAGIPVVETQAGKGALRWDHPQCLGPVGSNGGLAGNRLAREADLVLVVGSRLSDFTTASKTAFQHPDVRFIGLNVAEFDAYKHVALPLACDARVGLEELSQALAARGYHVDEAYRQRIAVLRDQWNAEVDRVRHLNNQPLISQGEIIGIVNDAAGPGDVVVCAAGGLPGDLLKLWRTSRPGGYHVEYGYSCMGYEIAGGLGVKMATPEHEVYVMVGDGSYLMLSGEIATSIQEGYKLIIGLLDNHGFGCIRALSNSCGGDNPFNEFRFRDPATGQLAGPVLPIDYAANAASLGAHAITARGRQELAHALKEAKAADRTTVIVVEVDGKVGVPSYESWWDVPVAAVSESAKTRTVRETYVDRKAMERWFV